MKKHILAFAATLLTTAVAYALPSAGDIYSIDPISVGGLMKSYEPGETVQFRVRLLARDWNAASDDPHEWSMQHIGSGSEVWDDVYNPLRLGVVVSGRLCEADIIDIKPGAATGIENIYPYTDIICEYKVKSSDLALPLLLALEGSTPDEPKVAGSTEASSGAYYLKNADKWQLKCNGQALNPWFCTSGVAQNAKSKWGDNSEIGVQTADYSLSKANLRIKAIDFDKNEDSANYWREVRENSNECVKYTPSIETIGMPTNSISLYVWSKNDEAVRLSGDAVEREFSDETGTIKRYVKTIKIIDGKSYYPIDLWGVKKGFGTELVLSPTLGYQFDSAGKVVENYITRKVYCTDPPKPSVQICFDPARPTASKSLTVETSTESMADLAKDAKPLYIWLSKANDVNMTVTVKVENLGESSIDPIDNGNIAISANGSFFDKDDIKHLSVEIPAGDTLATLYLYPLGGDVNTQNSGIKLTPVLDAESAAKYPGDSAAVNYRVKVAPAPSIVQPAEKTDIGTVPPVGGFDLPVEVMACYRDMKGKFTVMVKAGTSELYKSEEVTFSEDATTEIHCDGYSYNKDGLPQTATLTITAADGRLSATREFTFTVAAQKTVAADFILNGEPMTRFDENEAAASAPQLKIVLSEPAQGQRWAYLVGKNDAAKNLVNCKAMTSGVLIEAGETTSDASIDLPVYFKDGCAMTDGSNGTLEFEVVLRKSATPDGEIDSSFASKSLSIKVTNVPAAVTGVYLGDTLIPDTGDSTTPFEVAVPSGVEMTYNIKIDEPSPIDFGDKLVTIVRWTTDRAMTTWTKNPKIIKSSDALVSTDITLTMPETTHRVKIVTLDKDTIAAAGITDADYASGAYLLKLPASTPQYNFVMKVATAPHVIVDTYGFAKGLRGPTMDEKGGDGTLGTEKTARIRVRLSEPAVGDSILHLVAIPNNDNDMGTLAFYDCASSGIDGEGRPYIDLEIKDGTTEPVNNKRGYKEGQGVAFKYTALDGTVNSYVDGWTIEASVEGGGYEPDDSTTIYVQNLAPVISPEQEENLSTNMTKQAGIAFPLKWKAADVTADQTWNWPNGKKGLRAEWYINGELQEDGAMAPEYFSTTDWKTTDITLDEGFSTLELRVYDKDADEDAAYVASRKWLYAIPTQKRLIVTPIGPQEASKTKYRAATGRGLGRVWANGGNPTVSAFTQSWNYRVDRAEAEAWAYAYPAGDYVDDGSLDPVPDRDIAIDVNGEKWSEGKAYYPIKTGHDNFFYTWAYVIPAENGAAPSIELGIVQPTTAPNVGVREMIALDPYDEKKASYASRQLEAIFSRELISTDNMGDINGDGIPDLYLGRYLGLGVVDDLGTRVGDDLTAIGGANPDGDMLPGDVSAPMGTFIPGVSNNWNRAFTNRDEIRGVGSNVDITIAENERVARHHFNDGPTVSGIQGVKCDVKFTDPTQDAESTISELEYIAFTNWCGRVGKDPTDETLWATKAGWSPENPTDPTLADTDGDGMPDGYEYYFWYKAHVGEVEYDKDGKVKPETYRRMTGRKYVPTNPWEPEIISSDYIETLCNPNIRNSDFLATTDTDNDGITDLDEFFAGTNPFDYDTDHDGLPDGYELAISKTNPLKADGESNVDGDQMAAMTVPMWRIDYTNSVDATGTVITNTVWTMTEPKIGIVEGATNVTAKIDIYTGYIYSIDGDGKKIYALGRTKLKASDTKWEVEMAKCPIVNAVDGDEEGTLRVNVEDVKLIHFQVYQHEGFHPATAWNSSAGAIVGLYLNHRVNTQDYTALDEFMSMTFFMNVCKPDKFGPNDVNPKNGRTIVNSWVDYGTDPLNADTDGDGVPDGWEMYVMGGGRLPTVENGLPTMPKPDYDNCEHPHNFNGGQEGRHSPLRNWNGDAPWDDMDGLNYVGEFASTESCARYANCETIANKHPKQWINKYWPTDPWNDDTDGDGIMDGNEFVMIYGTAEPDAHLEAGVPGGGLNPNSWDTDLDRLPDGWEYQYMAAIVRSESFSTSVKTETDEDGNEVVTTNSVAEVVQPHPEGGMDPTMPDALSDYDHDGLNNWQEYMVGAMRCWRYDDTTSPWTIQEEPVWEDMTDEDFYRMLVSPWADGKSKRDFNTKYNPYLMFGSISPLNYFTRNSHSWDLASGILYMLKDGVNHDLRDDTHILAVNGEQFTVNRWGKLPIVQKKLLTYDVANGAKPYHPLKYISCDPTNADTDGDGMDDYYELFHGLNPLLGSAGEANFKMCDIVYMAYYNELIQPNPQSALNNYWLAEGEAFTGTLDDEISTKHKTLTYDFVQFPWLNGLPEVDPDGDNIRNDQEKIMPDVQAAPTYQHTDPTPLWMTDSSYTNSIVARSYKLGKSVRSFKAPGPTFKHVDAATGRETVYRFEDLPTVSMVTDNDDGTVTVTLVGFTSNPFQHRNTIFNFEENEGYDTDHDYLSDFEESQGKTKSSSDPLVSDSPIRHQAMYFNGKDAFMQTPLPVEFEIPGDDAKSEFRQNYLYFTVEAWVKADEELITKDGLSTVIERAIATGESNAGDESFLRKNFLIGVKNGRWYAKFDSTGTDLFQSVEIKEGPLVSTNWTHVAATFGPASGDETDSAEPMALKLYVDGVCRKTLHSGVQPEHGIAAITKTPGSKTYYYEQWRSGLMISTIVGASVCTINGISIEDAKKGDHDSFFKGYIDEVRLWDGARTGAAIKSDFENKVRYTSETAIDNRKQVYALWSQNIYRTPNPNTKEMLPAELLAHWSFDHVPSAVEMNDVMTVPAGFSTNKGVVDAKALWSRPADYKCGWWNAINEEIRSKVFKDTAWVPWIGNTVAHLPMFDGETLDSVLWHKNYYGFKPSDHEYGYPNSAEPVSSWVQQTYSTPIWEGGQVLGRLDDSSHALDKTQVTSWERLGDDKSLTDRYRFTMRNRLTRGADLLPMGSVYAKRISANEGGMWDDASASDAWAETGVDADNNGLPEWWEDYAAAHYDPSTPEVGWDTQINYHGALMPAWMAYMRDIAAGMLPDGKVHPEFADTRDMDKDSLPDWWEDMYGINHNKASDADDDPDHDGLSNYQEYVLGEVYPQKYNLESLGVSALLLNPTLDRSGENQQITDYFLSYGKQATPVANNVGKTVFELNNYFGEIVNDHDFMEDWWENAAGANYADAKKYDPLADKDEDGWSNWAECRAALWGAYFSAELIDKWMGMQSQQHVVCYPEPIIGVKVSYYGVRDISGTPLVIRTTSGQTQRVDATFTIPALLDGQVRYIGGFNADGVMHGHMSPGNLNPNSVVFECARTSSDQVYSWNCDWYKENVPNEIGWDYDSSRGRWYTWSECSRTHTGKFEQYRDEYARWPYAELEGGDFTWLSMTQTVPAADLRTAKLVSLEGVVMGSVNCITGEYELDMSKFAKAGGPRDYVYRVSYTSRVGHEWPQIVYVSDTRELASGNGSEIKYGNGRVREGKNRVEVFYDLNNDGQLDANEPYGVVNNVQIGWHKVPTLTIELKDDSSIMPTIAVGSGANGTDGQVSTSNTTSSIVGSLTKTVRVVREAINETAMSRVLLTKTVVLDDRPYLTEADACTLTKPDLDWIWLMRDAERYGIDRIESATYAVYELDDDGIMAEIPISRFKKTFADVRPMAMPITPLDNAPVYSASPSFTFSTTDTSATAYCLEVADAKTNIVYKSGMTMLPGRSGTTAGTCAYTVTPPIYAGAQVYTGVEPNHKIFFDGSNYLWRVALCNARYNKVEDKDWSAWADFQLDIANKNRYPDMPTGFGARSIAVRYYGAARNLTMEKDNHAYNTSNIVVEAYENADFRGQAMAQIRLAADDTVTDSVVDLKQANAILRGLKPGQVYFRAFYDQNGNGVRDRWESWGYANYVGSSQSAIYNPKGETVTSGTADAFVNGDAKVIIFIEDCDVNVNENPDCLEATKFAADTSDEETESIPWWDWVEADQDDVCGAMAYFETEMWLVTLKDEVEGTTHFLADCDESYIPASSGKVGAIKLYHSYDYASGLRGLGEQVATDVSGCVIFGDPMKVKVVLIHEQVREKFGFSSKTAIPGGTENTKDFTALDKRLVLRYLEKTGRLPAAWAADIAKAMDANLSFEDYVYNSGNESLYKKYTLTTDTDTDGDGIDDGWELYVGANPLDPNDRTSDADNDGLELWQEYDKNLVLGTVLPTDPFAVDTDNDGVLDYYAYAYHLKGDEARSDLDGDGLSNYAEYLITEVFKFAKCDPTRYATNDGVCDYFNKVGHLYLGEIFTDHDQMADTWEDTQAGIHRDIYDAHRDANENGWSNYAEYRASMDELTFVQVPVTNEIVCADGTVSNVVSTALAYSGKPTPNITVKVAYNGTQKVTDNVVVQAWTDKTMTTQPRATWKLGSTNLVASATSGNTRVYKMREPTTGTIVEGPMTFAVFFGAGTDDKYTAGQPWGFVRDVNVGWNSVEVEVELTDVSPVFARINVNDGSSDRLRIWGNDFGIGDTAETMNDVVMSNRVYDAQIAAETLSGGNKNHVRIVPYVISGTLQDAAVNEEDRLGIEALSILPNRVVAEFDIDVASKSFITEADFIKDGAFDIYWNGFSTTDFAANDRVIEVVEDVTAVKYGIVLGATGALPLHTLDTNTPARVFSTLIERRYESWDNRTLPTELKLQGGEILYGGNPTFTWRLDEPTETKNGVAGSGILGCSYTAFRLQILDRTDMTVVYDSGLKRAPRKNAEGAFVWTAPIAAGQTTANGKVFSKTGNWMWRVGMYNAKFNPEATGDDGWCKNYGVFSTSVGTQQETGDHDYGSIKVAVKYAGPKAVLVNGTVRVEAYATPDFSGRAIAVTEFSDKNTLAKLTDNTANCSLDGLELGGTYYARAYIDTNGNGVKDIWESWGCSKEAATLVTGTAAPLRAIWIEDCDTDGDWLPDAWEIASYGSLDHDNAVVDSQGEIVLKTTTYNSILDGTANFSSILSGASMTLFQNFNAAALLLGVAGEHATIADIRKALSAKIAAGTLKVSGLMVDAANHKIKLTVGAKVTTDVGGQLFTPIYQLTAPTKITISIYQKSSLVVNEWTWVKDYEVEITVGAMEETITVDISEDLTSGFYKVEVTE